MSRGGNELCEASVEGDVECFLLLPIALRERSVKKAVQLPYKDSSIRRLLA